MSSGNIVIAEATESLPVDIARLAAESGAAGIRNVSVLSANWADGSARFDGPGEMLLVAWSGEQAVGVGGISQCPDVPGALRVRRFYVGADHRRRGIARLLAGTLIAHGLELTDTLTCNAKASAAAPPFWETMGFVPVDVAGITHQLFRT